MVFIQKIFQNRNLALLWLGQMASQSGDSIYQIGLLWLVLELSGSTSVTGMVAMASYLPAVLFSLVAGVTADRNDRRKIMLVSDAFRFFLIFRKCSSFYCLLIRLFVFVCSRIFDSTGSEILRKHQRGHRSERSQGWTAFRLKKLGDLSAVVDHHCRQSFDHGTGNCRHAGVR